MSSLPFSFEIPVSFFEKAEAAPGRTKRFGGIVSTETRDRQKDIILQRGLDFSDFIEHGWFNDNHSRKMEDILGYPEKVQFFKKGDTLPDGSIAKATGHWAEGYLLDTPKACTVWELGRSLQKTNRRLGFSVEGAIDKRTGPDQRIIAKARVKHVAITHVPVNAESRLEILAKSLAVVEMGEPLEKMLTATSATPGVAPVGPVTGAGAGAILAPESLETDEDVPNVFEIPEKKKSLKKALFSREDAVAWAMAQQPNMSREQAGRFVDLTLALKRQGKL